MVWVWLRRWAKVTFSYPRELGLICFLIILHWSLTCFFAARNPLGRWSRGWGCSLEGSTYFRVKSGFTVGGGSLPSQKKLANHCPSL